MPLEGDESINDSNMIRRLCCKHDLLHRDGASNELSGQILDARGVAPTMQQGQGFLHADREPRGRLAFGRNLL